MVRESIMGPKKILRVQGSIVIDRSKEISTKEAPLVAKKVVKARRKPAERPCDKYSALKQPKCHLVPLLSNLVCINSI